MKPNSDRGAGPYSRKVIAKALPLIMAAMAMCFCAGRASNAGGPYDGHWWAGLSERDKVNVVQGALASYQIAYNEGFSDATSTILVRYPQSDVAKWIRSSNLGNKHREPEFPGSPAQYVSTLNHQAEMSNAEKFIFGAQFLCLQGGLVC